MKKIVPFKKDIPFKTNLYEVTSISLEHSLHKEDNEIVGNFIISGEYRITETSINTEKFSYDLPFNIDVDSKYNIDNVDIDINDFYYEILDNKSLVINIEVKLDHIEEILIERKDIMEDLIDPSFEDILNEDINNEPVLEEVTNNVVKEEKQDKRCIEEEVKSLFSNMDSSDTYVSYKVYIVRENDTIESIMEKYSITSDELESYNNLNDIKLGDKIIIPYVKN